MRIKPLGVVAVLLLFSHGRNFPLGVYRSVLNLRGPWVHPNEKAIVEKRRHGGFLFMLWSGDYLES
jgi:hypothetical protein